jgi:LSD1 subclass zinc finger protein
MPDIVCPTCHRIIAAPPGAPVIQCGVCRNFVSVAPPPMAVCALLPPHILASRPRLSRNGSAPRPVPWAANDARPIHCTTLWWACVFGRPSSTRTPRPAVPISTCASSCPGASSHASHGTFFSKEGFDNWDFVPGLGEPAERMHQRRQVHEIHAHAPA